MYKAVLSALVRLTPVIAIIILFHVNLIAITITSQAQGQSVKQLKSAEGSMLGVGLPPGIVSAHFHSATLRPQTHPTSMSKCRKK